jgi:hypothetical protein
VRRASIHMQDARAQRMHAYIRTNAHTLAGLNVHRDWCGNG